MASMLDSAAVAHALKPFLDRVLSGETVTLGAFRVREDFLFTGKKDKAHKPIHERVLSMVYYDEDDDENPSTESFDGTMEDFIDCLDAHDVLSFYSDTDEIGD